MRTLKWTTANKETFKKLNATYQVSMNSFFTIMGNYSWRDDETKAFAALQQLMYDGAYVDRDWVGTLYIDSINTVWCRVLHAMKDHKDPIIVNTIIPRLIDCITNAVIEIESCEVIDTPAEECINAYNEERGEF